ncbi:MAG: hypothetical protein ACFB0G_11325 [Leptolyngbyaceae cyanobacterium]
MTLQTEPQSEASPEGFANSTRSTPEAPPKHDPEVPVWVKGLIALDYQKGTFSQEAIAKIIGKSSAAVRQVIKAIQQHVPRHALITDDGITELGKTLILRSQNRGDLSMARWIAQLGGWLGAMPETRQWAPIGDDAASIKRTVEETKAHASAIELRSKAKLERLRDRYSNVATVADERSEADINLKAQEAYERKIDELAAIFEAERKAEEDFDLMKQELGA